MTRVYRYPRMSAAACIAAVSCAILRDLCVREGLTGASMVLLCMTILLLASCFVLLSCRFFVDVNGIGVGVLLRVKRSTWEELASLGTLCCNGRRMYLYGMYRGEADFLRMLHRAPYCGRWGFVVPLNRRLIAAVDNCCPFEVDFSHTVQKRHEKRLRPLLQQTILYGLTMIPASAVAFATAGLMLVRGAERCAFWPTMGCCAAAGTMLVIGGLLLYRAMLSVYACPRFNEEGVSAGWGLYMPWEDVRFGYVQRMAAHGSGMFMLSETVEGVGRRGCEPVRCLSLPDSSTLLLAYLTYCPHAQKK